MKKMTIEEAAKHFGISKEAIHNRIRRGTLQAVVEGATKFVLLDPSAKTRHPSTPKSTNPYADKLYSVLEEQNKELREKIEKLENETKTLRQEKERLLIEERKRIEQIYKEKDEQLKSILSSISSRFLLEAKPVEEEHFEAQIEETPTPNPVPLKKYLKNFQPSKKKREKLLRKITKLTKTQERFILKKDKIYIDPNLYDYSDLF